MVKKTLALNPDNLCITW